MKPNELLSIFGEIVTAYDCWRWVSTEEDLPRMVQEVLVWGKIDKINICNQIHVGRRWSGWTSGWEGQSEGKDPPWEWLNPQDIRIAEVTHWMYYPEVHMKK